MEEQEKEEQQQEEEQEQEEQQQEEEEEQEQQQQAPPHGGVSSGATNARRSKVRKVQAFPGARDARAPSYPLAPPGRPRATFSTHCPILRNTELNRCCSPGLSFLDLVCSSTHRWSMHLDADGNLLLCCAGDPRQVVSGLIWSSQGGSWATGSRRENHTNRHVTHFKNFDVSTYVRLPVDRIQRVSTRTQRDSANSA